jgi:hypothetical protein
MAGPRLQVEQVSTEDSSKLLNVVFDEESGSIAIDYSPYYERIATAIESISTAVTNTDTSNQLAIHAERIADSLETSDSSILADNLQSMVNDINSIKVLAETTGIKTVSPYAWIELVSIYKYLIDEGTLLQTNTVSTEEIEQATSIMIEYLNKIKALPTGTD